MKQLSLLLVIILIRSAAIYSQDLIIPNKPYTIFNSSPGYITVNEITAGLGLGDVSVPYSRSFIGFNTIHGYQINRNFIIGAGTGISFYNGGALIPLFLDVRFNFSMRSLNPYLSGDGGLFLNPSGSAKLFINPGAGIRYSLSDQWSINLGTGLLIQVAETQNSFVNLKIGLTFKPR